ncbi:family 1 glycosylhydrolase [Lachnospiraceae bacterium 62-35]
MDRKSYLFIDVQAYGVYPAYGLRMMEREGVMLKMEDRDLELLRDNTVDFISFSYYNSMCASADPDLNAKIKENIFDSLENPYLPSCEWGWQIAPLGLRITLNVLYDRYRKPLFVSENGLGAVDVPDKNGYVEDDYRIDYMRAHIREMKKAVDEDGVDLMGYTSWGCIDLVSASSGEMS